MSKKFLPELLSPAGSKDAFLAAIDGGADAIYCGGTSFNARINAKNFTEDELFECVRLAHVYGVKVYVTLNTLLLDREVSELLSSVEKMLRAGVDAFIVADLGVARLLKAKFPGVELHASTQMSVHNSQASELLRSCGFSRIVPARELSLSDIKTLVDTNPLEVEIFTHGALCVSHSGQCLFSSLVGGRSGNRGLCAQPCRLPYSSNLKNSKSPCYPLSLKDLSLAAYVTDIIESGVHSLKIEGRMKSPEYVRDVTAVWRKLLDEGRNATPEEIKKLSEIFSRGGFTSGYFEGKISKSMLGIRTEADKLTTRELNKFTKITRKLPIDIKAEIRGGRPSELTLACGKTSVTITGDIPMSAINSPIDEGCVKRSLSKLGDTPFEAKNITVGIDGGLMMPVSRLNDLRRQGVSELSDKLAGDFQTKQIECSKKMPNMPSKQRKTQKTGVFLFPAQITDTARKYFDKTFLPLERYDGSSDGFILPPVIFDSEKGKIKSMTESAINLGATCVMVGNIGNLSLVQGLGLEIYGDYRFNVSNNYTAAFLESLGVSNITLSPELTLPQIRDIKGDTAVIVYGRIPLMTLEKCVIRDLYGCSACDRYNELARAGQAQKPLELCDRKGVNFPLIRTFEHRNILYNSLPTCMSDKEAQLSGANITNRVFLFTTETPKDVDEVISIHKNRLPYKGQVRRI